MYTERTCDGTIGRRELLTRTAPACAMGCLGLTRLTGVLGATAAMGGQELHTFVRLLNVHSAAVGRRTGEQQAQNSPDTGFQTFVSTFRPPNYASSLTHEVVEDTENAFGLRVTECVWADVFREAGLSGTIGHAAVCNMDYYWPTAFNQKFRMERTKTLMQGHDHCNHRHLQSA